MAERRLVTEGDIAEAGQLAVWAGELYHHLEAAAGLDETGWADVDVRLAREFAGREVPSVSLGLLSASSREELGWLFVAAHLNSARDALGEVEERWRVLSGRLWPPAQSMPLVDADTHAMHVEQGQQLEMRPQLQNIPVDSELGRTAVAEPRRPGEVFDFDGPPG